MRIQDVKNKQYRNILTAISNNKTVTQACKTEGVPPKEFYQWKNSSQETKDLFLKVKDVMSDNVEMALYNLCTKDKNVNAIKFWLVNCRPDQWKNRTSTESKKDVKIEKTVREVKEDIKNIFGLSEEDVTQMESEL